MFLGAEELVAPGGPSAPVWAFLSAISLAIIGVIGQQVAAKREARAAKNEAAKAAQGVETAVANTANISNGFAGRVDSKLDAIIEEQNRQGDALRRHLEWHLHNEGKEAS